MDYGIVFVTLKEKIRPHIFGNVTPFCPIYLPSLSLYDSEQTSNPSKKIIWHILPLHKFLPVMGLYWKIQALRALPIRFKWGDINYDSTPGIGTFSYADYQYFSRNFEMLYCPGQSKRIRRNNTNISLKINKGCRIKILWINRTTVNICKNLKFTGTTHVVAIAGSAI